MHFLRSSLRLLAAAGLCLAATLTAVPAAHADTDPLDLAVSSGSGAIAQGVGPSSAGKTMTVAVRNYGAQVSQGTTVTVTHGSTSAVTMSVAPGATGCTTTATALTCSVGALAGGGTLRLVPVVLRVRDGVQVGAAAQFGLRVTGTYQGKSYSGSNTGEIDVVASGPDLVAVSGDQRGVKAGSTVRMPVAFSNGGDQPVTGVTLEFMLPIHKITYPTAIDGCSTASNPGNYQMICSFPDTVLQPGHGYELRVDSASGLPLTFPGSIAGPAAYLFAYNVRGGAEAASAAAAARSKLSHPGKAKATLVDAGTAARANATDADPSDNTGFFSLTTATNPADLGVAGIHLYGQVGDVLPATVAVRDNGPGDTPSRADVAIGQVTVTAPSGTVFSAVPGTDETDCIQVVNGKPDWGDPIEPGHRQYVCELAGNTGYLPAGSTESLHFALTIQQATVGADGSLVLDPMSTPDPNSHNNTAPFTVAIGSSPSPSPSASGGSGHPSASPSTPVAGGNGGGSGSLPVTGTRIGLYAGVGAAVLLGGAVLVVLARRRRARG